MSARICRVAPGPDSNHGKPCVAVDGLYDGRPRSSCLYCGLWMDELLEARTFRRDEIAAVFEVSPELIGEPEVSR